MLFYLRFAIQSKVIALESWYSGFLAMYKSLSGIDHFVLHEHRENCDGLGYQVRFVRCKIVCVHEGQNGQLLKISCANICS